MARYCNAKVDGLLRQGAATFARAKRIAAYDAVQKQIALHLPYIFICQISEVDAIPADFAATPAPYSLPLDRWLHGNDNPSALRNSYRRIAGRDSRQDCTRRVALSR